VGIQAAFPPETFWPQLSPQTFEGRVISRGDLPAGQNGPIGRHAVDNSTITNGAPKLP
jgi:hypothetical protein